MVGFYCSFGQQKQPQNVFQYTGHFKVKRMVQPRILHKNNPAEHHGNAILKFLKKRSQNSEKPVAFVSADAKCKVSIEEPGFPMAAVSRGKKVIFWVLMKQQWLLTRTLARFQSFQMLYYPRCIRTR